MKTNRVTFDVAEQILFSRTERYIIEKLWQLKKSCRHVWAVDINSNKYLMICSHRHGHHGDHEDIDGGVYCERN